MLFIKKQIINLFYDIKKIFGYMLDDNWLYFKNKSSYFQFLNEIFNLLSNTLIKIENIYYKYFLFEKLHHMVK